MVVRWSQKLRPDRYRSVNAYVPRRGKSCYEIQPANAGQGKCPVLMSTDFSDPHTMIRIPVPVAWHSTPRRPEIPAAIAAGESIALRFDKRGEREARRRGGNSLPQICISESVPY